MSDVHADITFVVDTGEKPVSASHGPGGRLRQRMGTFETKRVAIADARGPEQASDLGTRGFALVSHATSVRDFHDHDEVRAVYYPEVEQLLREQCGAERVVIFDHTVRSGSESEQERLLLREPVRIAHNDYTEWSGPQRLRDILPDEAPALLERRFGIVQVWRATHDPIAADPLALCDGRSVAQQDWVAAERRHADRVGEIYQLQYGSQQRWHWFPNMARDEALVFTVYDSLSDGRARFTPHVSFVLEGQGDAPPRRSIETRALVLYAS